jgi:SAM-dependent methyltransferase
MNTHTEQDYLNVNRRLWNEKTGYHVDSAFYDNESFLQTRFSLKEPETTLLGDIRGKTVLHLQCHFGQDTISISTLGGIATGLDFSDAAINAAVSLAARTKSNAQFVCTDVYSAPEVLQQEFDVVFSSYGTIGWLPDMDRWAQVIARCLKPGGRFVFAEFHPVMWMYNPDFSSIAYSYFNREAIVETTAGTYADRHAPVQLKEVGWNHALGEVIGALLRAGLRIRHFEELDYSPWNCFQNMTEDAPGRFMIKGLEGKLPVMYTLEAVKGEMR